MTLTRPPAEAPTNFDVPPGPEVSTSSLPPGDVGIAGRFLLDLIRQPEVDPTDRHAAHRLAADMPYGTDPRSVGRAILLVHETLGSTNRAADDGLAPAWPVADGSAPARPVADGSAAARLDGAEEGGYAGHAPGDAIGLVISDTQPLRLLLPPEAGPMWFTRWRTLLSKLGSLPIGRIPLRRTPARPRDQQARRARLATLFTWVRNVGAIMVLFVFWQLWGTSIAEHHAQDALRLQFEAKVHSGSRPPGVTKAGGSRTPGQIQLIPASERFGNPAEGSVVAQLSIPKIALNQYVVSGTAAADLAKGPGHYIGTALPGQAGNVAIAGHRTTHGAPFNRLAELAPGDPIYLTTTWGERLTYIVSQTPYPVSPSDVAVLDAFGDNRLTLTTCNPEYSAAQRLIVVAELQEPATATSAAQVNLRPRPYDLGAQADPGWNWGELPLALLVVATLTALGLAYRRLAVVLGGLGRWIVLLPIWIAGLYLLFGTLGNLLPASV